MVRPVFGKDLERRDLQASFQHELIKRPSQKELISREGRKRSASNPGIAPIARLSELGGSARPRHIIEITHHKCVREAVWCLDSRANDLLIANLGVPPGQGRLWMKTDELDGWRTFRLERGVKGRSVAMGILHDIRFDHWQARSENETERFGLWMSLNVVISR